VCVKNESKIRFANERIDRQGGLNWIHTCKHNGSGLTWIIPGSVLCGRVIVVAPSGVVW